MSKSSFGHWGVSVPRHQVSLLHSKLHYRASVQVQKQGSDSGVGSGWALVLINKRFGFGYRFRIYIYILAQKQRISSRIFEEKIAKNSDIEPKKWSGKEWNFTKISAEFDLTKRGAARSLQCIATYRKPKRAVGFSRQALFKRQGAVWVPKSKAVLGAALKTKFMMLSESEAE